MAKCNCPGSSCSCLIVGGANVEVQGVGTNANPYTIIVDLSELELDDRIQVNDSSSVNFTLLGTGTPGDPLILTAAVLPATLPGDVTTSVPAAAGTTAIAATESMRFLDHPATIASHTITLPAGSTALGKEVTVNARSIITALTVDAAVGATVVGAPTTLPANGFFRMRLVGTVWRRVG